MQGRVPPWGPLAVPVSYRSEFPALLLFMPRRHTEAQSRSQEASIQCLYPSAHGQAASPLPPGTPHLRSALIRPHLRVPSGSNLRFQAHLSELWYRVHNPDMEEFPSVYRRRKRRLSWERKEPPLQWAPARGRSEHGGESKFPKTD